MRTNLTVLLASLFVLTGCGPSKTELADKQRVRFELEERQRLEAERANKAITEMNQNLSRKVPMMDLGLPPAKQATPAPEKAKRP